MTFGIYCIEHVESGRKYIGKSKNIEDRFKKHRTQLLQKEPKNGVNRYLWNLVNKYGIDSLKFWIVEEVSPQDDAVLADREVFWMDELKTLDRKFGFNLRRDSSSCTTFTPEMKDNIRKGKLGEKNPNYGKPMHPNCREALRIRNSGPNNYWWGKCGELSPNYGIKRSEETKNKLRESKLGEKNPNYGLFGADNPNFGRKCSEEQIKNMSDKMKGRKFSESRRLEHSKITHKYSYEQYDLFGNFLKVYRHQDDLTQDGFLPPNVCKAISKKTTHHGYYWRKIPKIESGKELEYSVENKDKKITIDRLSVKGWSLYEQYDCDDSKIRDYTSKELKEFGFDLSTVLKCCKGLKASYKGFKWRKIPKPSIDTPPQPEV